MRFLCHENRSTGSIKDARGYIDRMEGQELNALPSWKEKDFKI
jgi:hypothetical protein